VIDIAPVEVLRARQHVELVAEIPVVRDCHGVKQHGEEHDQIDTLIGSAWQSGRGSTSA